MLQKPEKNKGFINFKFSYGRFCFMFFKFSIIVIISLVFDFQAIKNDLQTLLDRYNLCVTNKIILLTRDLFIFIGGIFGQNVFKTKNNRE